MGTGFFLVIAQISRALPPRSPLLRPAIPRCCALMPLRIALRHTKQVQAASFRIIRLLRSLTKVLGFGRVPESGR
jgi:hypothetical protein